MKPNRPEPAETVSNGETANTDRVKAIPPNVDRSEPETPVKIAENGFFSDDRLDRAARHCPPEFRPAYIHLLRELFTDNEDVYFEDAPPMIHFERAVLIALACSPELDPWTLSEIADTLPRCREFAEQLRMLSRLRQREHV